MIFRNNRGFNVKSAMFARLIWRAQKTLSTNRAIIFLI